MQQVLPGGRGAAGADFRRAIDPAEVGGNQGHATGLTERAPAKAKQEAVETGVETGNQKQKTRRRSTA